MENYKTQQMGGTAFRLIHHTYHLPAVYQDYKKIPSLAMVSMEQTSINSLLQHTLNHDFTEYTRN